MAERPMAGDGRDDAATDTPLARVQGALRWRGVPAEPIEATLMRLLGLAPGEGGDVPSANAWSEDLEGEARACVAAAVAAGEAVMRADPVHLSPDRDTALMLAPEALGLTPAESDALVDALDRFVRQDGLRLHAAGPTRWYLTGPDLPIASAPPPQVLAGRRVSELDAAGSVPAGLRSLISELEMLLYGHPVNEARRARGALAVSALHLHGSARPWTAADTLEATAGQAAASVPPVPPVAVIAGGDPFARAAARAAGSALLADDFSGTHPGGDLIVVERDAERAALVGDAAALRDALERVAERWLSQAPDDRDAGAPRPELHAGGGRMATLDTGRATPAWRRALARLRALLS